MNPYLRQSAKGEVFIRVDDPKSVVIGDLKSICWCCTEEAEKLSKCAKCDAKYCSKECQVFDWKEQKHKIVCQNK